MSSPELAALAPVVPGWRRVYSGKVRDLYVPEPGSGYEDADVVLVVASDRISAYDFILQSTIPDKGKVLTQLSLWWFEQLTDIVPNHVVSTDVPAEVAGRAMICQRLDMYPVECVVRGYLTGSGFAEYQASGEVCGISLAGGLVDGDRLVEPIFTPATKAAVGDHDENVSFEVAAGQVGFEVASQLRDLSLKVYGRARDIAEQSGIILADTKFEFGHDGQQIVLGDEVLTPDSSRFWDRDEWVPGVSQASFDKQFVRDWLTGPDSGWDKTSDVQPPRLPADVVERTRERYVLAYERLTGSQF